MDRAIESIGGKWIKARPEWAKEAFERAACLDMFMDKFGIDAPLVSLAQVAKVLGMSRQWVYAQIKAGEFFLPLRMAGATPLVPVDALIDWYLGRPGVFGSVAVQAAPRAAKLAAAADSGFGSIDVDGMVAQAIGEMRAQEWKRPRGAASKSSSGGRPGGSS